MEKFTCPYCYGEHQIKDCILRCSYNIPGQAVSCKYGLQKNPDGSIQKKYISKCMKCTEAKKMIYCPTMGKEIPSSCLNDTGLPIALIGAKASGKSNYIAVLINEIRKRMTGSFNCSLDIGCSDESKTYYDNYYYKPLYERKEVVEATDKGVVIPPLIFPLRFMDNRNRTIDVATLTFYDTAGENFESSDSLLVLNQYIPNAKGIILLLDPLQVPSIRSKLQGKMELPEKNTDVETILSRVVQVIRDVKNIDNKKKIKIPIALVFTKMDALEKFDIIPKESSLREESAHLEKKAFDLSEFENTNIEMRGILENWLDEEVLQMMKQFTKCAIFGLSALGGIPNRTKVQNNEIDPKRALDPLLWILAENKYIKTIKR